MTLNDIIKKIDGACKPDIASGRILFKHWYELEKADRDEARTAITIKASELGVLDKLTPVLSDVLDGSEAEQKRKIGQAKYKIPLDITDGGTVKNTIENFCNILRNDEYFSGIAYNLLTLSAERRSNGKATPWKDVDDSHARCYIEKEYGINSEKKYMDAFRIVCDERSYHPVKERIEAVKWDKKDRIETLLIKYMKVKNTPYSKEVSRLIFAGGINRLYNPGCKFDIVPVLIGTRQGEGKSTFVSWLALDDFSNVIDTIKGQEGVEALSGVWIGEIAELLAIKSQKDVEAVKSFITTQTDHLRLPYDRRVTDIPRQCILIGTTNQREFLTDKTGNRRFYPIEVFQTGEELYKVEAEAKEDILQCWAEALAKRDTPFMVCFTSSDLKEEVKAHQRDAEEDDYREGLIKHFLDTTAETEVCTEKLWVEALHIGADKMKNADSRAIGLIMNKFPEWHKSNSPKVITAYGKQRYWYKER